MNAAFRSSRILLLLTLTVIVIAFTGCGTQQLDQPNYSMSLADIQSSAPDAFEAIEMIKELAPVAEAGSIETPFVPKGILVEIPRVVDVIVRDQGLCKSIVGRNILYQPSRSTADHRNVNDLEIYEVHARLVPDSQGERCDVSLNRIASNEEIFSIIDIEPGDDIETRVLQQLKENRSSIDNISLWLNRSGELLRARLYRRLGPAENAVSQLFGVYRPPGPTGDPTTLYVTYDFVLGRAMRHRF